MAKLGIYKILSFSDANCDGEFEGSAFVEIASSVEGEILVNNHYCEGEAINLATNIIGEDISYLWSTNGGGQLVSPTSASTEYIPAKEDESLIFELVASNQCNEIKLQADTEIIRINTEFRIEPTVDEFMAQVPYTFIAEDTEAEEYFWNFGDGTDGDQSNVVATLDGQDPEPRQSLGAHSA